MHNVFKRLNIILSEDDLSDVNPKHHTPEGLFTKSADEIVRGLLKDSNNDLTKAIRRINFYINRAGDNLSNATEVKKAKRILEEKNK